MKKDLETILSYTQQDGECMIWTRCFNTDGYPRAAIDGNSNGKVHRVVWELTNQRSAKGLVIRHTCDNPKCIRPSHLVEGTPADNNRDRDTRARSGSAKLTADQVLEIRELWATKRFIGRELGRMFGVDHRTIYSIVNNHTWKFLL